jgi:hypothetical protein
MNKKIIIVIALIFALAMLQVPMRNTIVPQWRVVVVNENHEPLAGMRVRQVWQNLLLEENPHEEEIISDANGVVTFPERSVTSSPARRIYGQINVYRKFQAFPARGSSGNAAWLVAVLSEKCTAGRAFYLEGADLPQFLLVEQQPQCAKD